MVTYPLNNVDYDAADAELFHCTRTSGIFDGGDFACTVTGADNTVTVGKGIGWIRNTRFSGKVIAQKTDTALDLGVADSENPRIDAVVIRFDANAGKTEIMAKKGEAAANPVAPEVVQTEAVYELHLCHIYREAGAATISVGDLTDLRANSAYCGLMQDDVTPRGAQIVAEQLPVIPMNKGGTGAQEGSEGLKNLLAAGYMQLSEHQLKDEIPDLTGVPDGTVFLLPVQVLE